jgi:thiosulfate reductase cytochrome b subunit
VNATLYTHGVLSVLSSSKLLVLKTRKVLTLHGWVLDEAKAFYIAINWLLHRLIFIPLVYDYVTAVSHITAKKNGVKALIVLNPMILKV